ncbi:hypothetical protein LUZ60_011052 [Juncus effusus]|nr:hypothetical protein LUZ60_011052 [Juncus effusus]
MAKICIEICIISARGLCKKSSLLKPQWFAVGWIEPNDKYCTKIDASGSLNPSWKTKFSISVDGNDSKLENMSITIEVYRREPIFLRERLHGTAVVHLKEFLVKHDRVEKPGKGFEETGSFQLRKRNSGKAEGFVDVSISISKEGDGFASHSGPIEGITYSDQNEITLAIEDGPVFTYPSKPHKNPQTSPAHQIHNKPSSSSPFMSILGTPPVNTDTIPPFYHAPAQVPNSYINVGPSRPVGLNNRSGFGLGLGAGALAAGAMIFGDDFINGSSLRYGSDGASVVLSTDPMF